MRLASTTDPRLTDLVRIGIGEGFSTDETGPARFHAERLKIAGKLLDRARVG
jgi:hypothetical protein